MHPTKRIAVPIVVALTPTLFWPGTDVSAAKRLEVVPMTSIVRPIKLDEQDSQWEVVVQSHLDGQPIHDGVFRPPTGPTESVQVDCSQTQSIGVYFEVRSKSKHRDQMRPFRFSWSHSGINPEKPVRSDFKGAWILPRMQGVLLYSDHLKLTDPRRVNGEWQLRVYHMGAEIFREEFNLIFCERPYAPTWYRNNTAADSMATVGMGVMTVSGPAPSVDDDPLVREIDDTIRAIDFRLNDYIREYLASIELPASEFQSIERKLLRTVRQERKDNPASYKQIPENIHLLQAKVQFLQSSHSAFQDGQFPAAVKEQFARLAELEEKLRTE